MEHIIEEITEAEKRAAEIKNNALLKAQDVVAKAEAEASVASKQGEAERTEYKERAVKKAEEEANASYAEKISAVRAEAQKRSEEILSSADNIVSEIVRRVVGGNR